MQAIPKIIITTQADGLLEGMLKTVNEGFPSGRVKKMQLASWIIQDFHAHHFAKALEKIREDHFDEIAHLKSVVKQMEAAKKTETPIALDQLLSPLKARSAKPPKAKTTRTPAERPEPNPNDSRG